MFGRLLSFEPDATGVTVKFEHKEGRISFITDRIVRVYSSMEEKHRPSRAVVQEPKKVDFQARQQKEFITSCHVSIWLSASNKSSIPSASLFLIILL